MPYGQNFSFYISVCSLLNYICDTTDNGHCVVCTTCYSRLRFAFHRGHTINWIFFRMLLFSLLFDRVGRLSSGCGHSWQFIFHFFTSSMLPHLSSPFNKTFLNSYFFELSKETCCHYLYIIKWLLMIMILFYWDFQSITREAIAIANYFHQMSKLNVQSKQGLVTIVKENYINKNSFRIRVWTASNKVRVFSQIQGPLSTEPDKY